MVNKFSPFILLLLFTACSSENKKTPAFADMNWIDLTYTYDSTTLYWPNNVKGFQHSTEAEGKTALGFYYSSYSICTPEHGGTHLDAPIHFAENKLTVDQLPLSSLTGEAVVIDVSKNALANRDYLVSIADVEAWEKTNGALPENTIVLCSKPVTENSTPTVKNISVVQRPVPKPFLNCISRVLIP